LATNACEEGIELGSLGIGKTGLALGGIEIPGMLPAELNALIPGGVITGIPGTPGEGKEAIGTLGLRSRERNRAFPLGLRIKLVVVREAEELGESISVPD